MKGQLVLNPISRLSRTMWAHAEGRRGFLLLEFSLLTLASLEWVVMPLLIARVFNEVQYGSGGPGFLRFVISNLLVILGVQLSGSVLHMIARVFDQMSAFDIRRAYRHDLLRKVLELPAEWQRDHHSGETIDKINTASNALGSFTENLYIVIGATVRLVGSLAALLFFDWHATVLALVSAAVTFVLLSVFDRRIVPGYDQSHVFSQAVATVIQDTISNIVTVLTLRLQPSVLREVDRRARAPRPTEQRIAVLNEAKWFTTGAASGVITIGVLILYAYSSYVTAGTIALGSLFALYNYLGNVGGVFSDFAGYYGSLLSADASVRAADSILAAHRALVPRADASLPRDWRRIHIYGLSFDYRSDSAARFAIQNVDLSFDRGARIAFVGASGSGKTTTLLLLRGLYSAVARVECDGATLPHGLLHLMNHVTLVPQEPEIFNATIEENITMDVTYPKHVLNQVIALAQFRPVVADMPQGLKTSVVEKGVSLSGGQKQRLALARGLLAARDSDILLLDEPTSSVDALTEAAIYEGIFSAFADKTIISTVHRLHLLRQFDKAYFFGGGRILASGTFDDLLRHPEFELLWKRYLRSFERNSAKTEKRLNS
jgi:ATP-binding cassette, subfamily B, bacterial